MKTNYITGNLVTYVSASTLSIEKEKKNDYHHMTVEFLICCKMSITYSNNMTNYVNSDYLIL